MKSDKLLKKITSDIDIRDSIYQLLTMNPFAIQSIKGSYLDDEMWKYAIDLEPTVFQYIDSYKKVPSTKLCIYALKADGRNIQYIHPSRITDYMMDIAHQSCPTAHLLVADNDDEDIPYEKKGYTVKEHTYIQNMENKMNDSIIAELRKNPNMIKDITDPTDEMKAVALISNPDIVLYFDELTPMMAELLEEYYPDICNLYPNYLAYKHKHSIY